MVLSLANNTPVLRAKFSVNNATNTIQRMVNTTNVKQSIIAFPTGDNYQADYKFISGKFSFGGTIIGAIPLLASTYKTAKLWNIWQNENDPYPNLSYLSRVDNKWYDIVDNSENYGTRFICTIIVSTPVSGISSKNKQYYLRVFDKVQSKNIFVAGVLVNTVTNTVASIKNTQGLNKRTNLLVYTADDNYSDYRVLNNDFTMAGTSFSTIPALDSIYGATQWQVFKYNGVNCLAYKNSSNEWKTIAPASSANRYTVTLNTIKP